MSKIKEEQYEHYKKIIESYGSTMMSDKYVSANTNMTVKCKNGHIIKKRPRRFINGINCKICKRLNNKKIFYNKYRKI